MLIDIIKVTIMANDKSLQKINNRLKAKILRWLPQQNRIATAIEGLMLTRRDEISVAESCFYQPTVAIVLQGTKRSTLGHHEYTYNDNHCMVVGVDMPGVYHITEASLDKPFLSLSIKLNRYIITQLLAELPHDTQLVSKPTTHNPVVVTQVTEDLLKAFLRLVELLDKPAQIPVLAPLIMREIHFHLLTGEQGECLRMVCTGGTQTNRIAQAINWLRQNYTQPFNMDELAQRINMSPSTFYRHFRQVTTFSPLQFQKQLRLYEAERLMLLEGKDASTAALAVGYESITQFSREYKRQFGAPPYRDVNDKLTLGMADKIRQGAD